MIAHLSKFFTTLVKDTPLSYWLLEPDGQDATVFLTVILCCLIWYIFLDLSYRRSPTRASSESDSPSTPMLVKIMKNLAPPGHRPTNAQLDISPFHIKKSFATSTDLSNPYPTLPISDIPVDGHPSTLMAHDLAEKEFTPAPKDLALTLPPQGRNFAGLAKNAPFSYGTLRQLGMLDKDGSPTHKYASKKRLEELMSEQRK
jgi:hypothetical protein